MSTNKHSGRALQRFLAGNGGAELAFKTHRGVFRVPYSDQETPCVFQKNKAEGWFSALTRPDAWYRKSVQYQVLKKNLPDLVFDTYLVADLCTVPTHSNVLLVVRPDVSPGSRGSAVLIGLGEQENKAALSALGQYEGPFLVHHFEPGQPIFVNGVVQQGHLFISDAWECFLLRQGCRDILTSVISLPVERVSSQIARQLECAASALELSDGPVHFEVVLTSRGLKIVKISPRLATEPLPDLCNLDQTPYGQVPMFKDFCRGAELGMRLSPTGFVADYSLLVDGEGFFQALVQQNRVESLASFSHYHQYPKVGQWLSETTNGYSYGVTIFLKHPERDIILRDIRFLDELNQRGALLLGQQSVENP